MKRFIWNLKMGFSKVPLTYPTPTRPCMIGFVNKYGLRIYMQLQNNFVFMLVYINNKILKLVWHFSAKFPTKKIEQFIVDLLHEQFFKCILFEKAKDNCKSMYFSLKHVFWSNIDKCLVIVAQNKRELTFYNSLAWLIRPISYQKPVISILYFSSGKNCTIFFTV